MTNEELERAVERVAQMATDLEEFEYLNPPRAQASCDLRALLSERAELLAAVERMKDWAERIDAITWTLNTGALDEIISEMRRAALTTGEGK